MERKVLMLTKIKVVEELIGGMFNKIHNKLRVLMTTFSFLNLDGIRRKFFLNKFFPNRSRLTGLFLATSCNFLPRFIDYKIDFLLLLRNSSYGDVRPCQRFLSEFFFNNTKKLSRRLVDGGENQF